MSLISHINLSSSFFPLFPPPRLSLALQLSGRPVPPHLPTTSTAPPRRTVPTSPEGWASAAHSTRASSGAPGTSRAPPTPADRRPLRCHTATPRSGGPTAPRASSASSPPSLYAGEWTERMMGKQQGVRRRVRRAGQRGYVDQHR